MADHVFFKCGGLIPQQTHFWNAESGEDIGVERPNEEFSPERFCYEHFVRMEPGGQAEALACDMAQATPLARSFRWVTGSSGKAHIAKPMEMPSRFQFQSTCGKGLDRATDGVVDGATRCGACVKRESRQSSTIRVWSFSSTR